MGGAAETLHVLFDMQLFALQAPDFSFIPGGMKGLLVNPFFQGLVALFERLQMAMKHDVRLLILIEG